MKSFAYSFDLYDDERHENNIIVHADSAPEAWLLLATKVLNDDISTDHIELVLVRTIKE